tara:strand:- start:203 stop:1102 length:900 start_codon:yes stop_codon:yes gene_type:complete
MMTLMISDRFLKNIGEKPILLVGPTASGKSKIAMSLAIKLGRHIVNADSLQVYSNWRILTARPTIKDEEIIPHHLYGHKAPDEEYSVGHWLRDLSNILTTNKKVIIVGGTGLYFSALTGGLANIPKISDETKIISKKRFLKYGIQDLLKDLDKETLESIDINNQMRVIRAWEVLKETGKSLNKWQSKTGSPILPLTKCQPLVINPDKNDLDKKIKMRFEEMVKMGALDEARRNLDMWNQDIIASKAIGASELISYLKNEISLDEAITNASIATRQYAKRQRTWIKARMKQWDDVTELFD